MMLIPIFDMSPSGPFDKWTTWYEFKIRVISINLFEETSY